MKLKTHCRWNSSSVHMQVDPTFVQYHGENFKQLAQGVGRGVLSVPASEATEAGWLVSALGLLCRAESIMMVSFDSFIQRGVG
jgi:hypothetical protein